MHIQKLHWLHIVLVHPEIPPNTGNIIRLSAVTNAALHLIRPLGFAMDDRKLRRSGLDYWQRTALSIHDNWDQFLIDYRKLSIDKQQNDGSHPSSSGDPMPIFPVSTMGLHRFDSLPVPFGAAIVFGSESSGLPAHILNQYAEHSLFIPQWGFARSLNLANAVAVQIYAVARQYDYNPVESLTYQR